MVKRTKHVHFVGIGGYGMSAIARVLLDLGYSVSGSDVARKDLTDRLAARGAKVYIGHAPQQIEGADCVVYSTACSEDNIEITAAREKKIPVLHRAEMLAWLMKNGKGIAVAGAHGKTTTTSMIAFVMEQCGYDPTFIVGGVVSNIGENAKAGKGEYIVAEADESDGTFLHYRPHIAVVTSIEADHLENYDGSFDNLKTAYRRFMANVPRQGLCVLCVDDPQIRTLVGAVSARVVTYGFSADADVNAREIEMLERGSRSSVWYRGEKLGMLELSVPGLHNVQNALAAIAVCMAAGLPFPEIAGALKQFHGAERRFQVIRDADDILVIDDYAHHPTEIRATISAAKATGKRIVAVFQPQRYTRTFFLLDAFSRAFSEADEVIITNIYSPAGEKQIEGISAERLAQLIRENSNANVRFLPSKEEVLHYLCNTARPGDLVLTMGAGDIWKVAHQLAEFLAAGDQQNPSVMQA
jgi:UDP-N-acetylmuramate--alanine ligase